MTKFVLAIICILTLFSCSAPKEKTLTDYVNPFLGTAPLTDSARIGYEPPDGWRVWAGLVFPGASLPNAMVQLSPITKYHTGAGYQYEDSVIYGFTHTSKGHWNLCNIPLLPASGTITAKDFGSKFSHEKETAHPGYYQVYLNRYDVNVELTSTLRCGFHKYTFRGDKDKKLIVDLQKSNENVRDWDLQENGEKAFSGYQLTGDSVFFYAKTNIKIQKIDSLIQGERIVPVLHFEDSDDTLEIEIGLSYVSRENAKENLNAEIGNKSFGQIRKDASAVWEKLLSKIKVSGGTERQKMLFYSSLYRSFLWPVLRSDVNGDFRDAEGKVENKDFRYYSIPSLWDTYRNKVVLLGLIAPEVTSDVIKSLIDRGKITGFIPTFFHGDHAAAFIAGSYLRGIQDFDVQAAYQLLLNNATKKGGTRPYIKEYIKKGYVSTPVVAHPDVETKAKAGVAKTLEYAFDDYAVAQLAKTLGDTANYRIFMGRSKNYKNVFDTATHFMRGRLKNGEWVKHFNPQYPYYEYMYREANGWQLSFFAPHDMSGLIELYGGKKAFEAKLDSFFSIPWNPDYIARNISSFIGQYCVGNQPDHEAPFSYYFVGKPAKSQVILDSIMNHFYGIGSEGLALPGMDDAGEMSAWYVFTALGLYPYTSADDRYLVSVPLFDKVQWKTSTGKMLTIKKSGDSRRLKTIKVNGESQENFFISQQLFRSGDTLDIVTE
ncbi:MAG TPA: GH92 family glycosyl hydrolase [Chitinophagaceae bacterium]|nr:GH92 family glycosyl hydrolase [Chitinophagaceae bacterium]